MSKEDSFEPFQPLNPNGLKQDYGQYRMGHALEYIAKALGMLVALKMQEMSVRPKGK